MATFEEYEDDLMTCPYNPIHKVARRRYHQHVVKCGKTSDVQLAVCPFNSCHRMPQRELNAHLNSCPDSHQAIREIVQTQEMNKIKEEEAKSGPFQSERKKVLVDDDDEEDEWARSGSGSSYIIPALKEDNMEKLKKRDGFVDPLVLQRMSRAERNQFYGQRVENVKRKQDESDSDRALYSGNNDGDRDSKQELEGIRQPRTQSLFGGIGRGRPVKR